MGVGVPLPLPFFLLDCNKSYSKIVPMKNKIKIEGRHDDMIYPVRERVAFLQKICDQEYDALEAALIDDGLNAGLADYLFDYVYNSDPDKEPVTFEEFCDHDYMREFRKNRENTSTKKD